MDDKSLSKNAVKSPTNVSDIFDYALECVARIDRRGNYLSVNNRYAETCGYLPEEMIGLSWRETVHMDDHSYIEKAYLKMLQEGRAEVELRGIRRNGSTFFKRMILVRALKNSGSELGHYCFMEDITDTALENKNHSQTLNNNCDLQSLVKYIPGVVYRLNVKNNWKFDFISHEIEKMFGLTPSFFSRDARSLFFKYTYQEDIPKIKRKLRKKELSTDNQFSAEYRMYDYFGELHWVINNGTCLFDVDGNIEYIDGVIVDVSRTFQAESELSKREQVTSQMLEIISNFSLSFEQKITHLLHLGMTFFELDIGVFELIDGEDFIINDVTAPADFNIKKFSRSKIKNSVSSIIFSSKATVSIPKVSESIISKTKFYKEAGCESFFGSPIIIDDQIEGTLWFSGFKPYKSGFSDAKINFLEMMANWIAQQLRLKKAQKEIDDNERLIQFAFQSSPDAIYISNLHDGKLLSVNRAFEEATGFKNNDLINKTTKELGLWVNSKDNKFFIKEIETKGKIVNKTVKFRHKSGEIKYALLTSNLIWFNNQRCTMSIARDITEQRHTKNKVLKYQESICSLHEIMSSKIGFEEKTERILQLALDYLEVDSVLFGKIAGDFFNISTVKNSNEKLLFKAGLKIEKKQCVWGEIIEKNKPVSYVSLAKSKFKECDIHKKYGAKSYLGVPVVVNNINVGAICCLSTEQRKDKFSSSEIDLMQLIARCIGLELEQQENNLLVEMERNAYEIISKNISLNKIIEHLILLIESYSPVMFCSLLSYDDKSDRLVSNIAPSLPVAFNQKIVNLNEEKKSGIFRVAIDKQQKVVSQDIKNDLLWNNNKELPLSFNLKSCWINPIQLTNRELVGIFACYYQESRPPTNFEQNLIFRVTPIISYAIERHNTQQIVDKGEERFRKIFEDAPIGKVLLNPEKEICFLNSSFCKMLGYKKEELINKDFFDLILSGDYKKGVNEYYKLLNNKKDYVSFEVRFLHKDNSFVWGKVRLTEVVLDKDSKKSIIAQIVNTTKRKEYEITINARTRALKVLNDCNQAINRIKDERQLLQYICEVIINTGGYRFCWIGIAINNERKTVNPLASAGHDEGYPKDKVSWDESIPEGQGPTGICIRSSKPYIARNIAQDPNFTPWREAAMRHGFSSSVALPLIISKNSISALMIYSDEEDAFNGEEVELLLNLCGNLSHGIRSIRNYKQRKTQQSEIDRVNRVTYLLSECNRTVIHANNADDLMSSVCKLIVQLGGYLLAGIGVRNYDENKSVDLNWHWGDKWKYLENAKVSWAENKYGMGPAGKAIRSGEPCIIKNIKIDTNFKPWCESALNCGFRSVIGLPLIINGDVYGVLLVYSAKINAFNQAEIKLLESLSNNLAHGIDSLHARQQRDQAEKILVSNEEKYRVLVEDSGAILWEADYPEINFTYVSKVAEKILGFPTADWLKPNFWINHIHPDDKEYSIDFCSSQTKKGLDHEFEYRMFTKDCEIVWLQDVVKVVLDDSGNPCKLRGLMIDITAKKKAEQALSVSEERFSLAMKGASDGLWDWELETGEIYFSPRWKSMLGYQENEIEGELESFKELLHPDDIERTFEYVEEFQKGEIENYSIEFRMRHKAGHFVHILSRAFGVKNTDGKIVRMVGTHTDITENTLLSRQLEYQATHDALTDLVNRREFEKRLKRILNEPNIKIPGHAICYLDLDNFKVINDTCGHLAGDAMLKQLGEVLAVSIRGRDTLARLGGDEFGILMEHCSLKQAYAVAKKILSIVEDFRFEWKDNKFSIGVSIGLASINDTVGSVADVLSAVDSACYIAKESGRNRIHVFSPDDDELERRQGEMRWVSRINYALEENLFCLFYQEVKTIQPEPGNNKRFELLVRIKTHDGEYIMPGAFLPAAERYNLSTKIDAWVINSALSWLTSNKNFIDSIESCAINISGHSLSNEDFLENCLNKIDNYPNIAEKLCFEITETAAIANLNSARQFISKLKSRGCSFALDDFGSGLSSFGYLKNLSVDYIKIDGSFIKDLLEDPVDYEMVTAINRLGHAMGKRTIAEFVENDDIFQMLKDIGVDYAQGYAINKPQPIESFKIV